MSIFGLVVGSLMLSLIWYLSSFPRNYYLARRTGLPILLSPINPANPFWLVLSAMLEPVFAKYLPHLIYDRIKVAIYGWEFRCRYTVNAELGPVFVLVTPARNEVWIADPEMADAVLMRRKDFLQLEMSSRIMSLFGGNITSSNGDEWQRHRKIVAPVLNERIMSAVWEESSTQARDMLNTVTGSLDEHLKNSKNQGETNSVIEGVRTIAINVIGSTGFGQHHSWTQAASKAKAPVGHRLTFMEAILAIVNSHIVAVFVPASILTLPFMPKGIQALGAATTEFPRYAKYLITKERDTPGRADAQRTLMGALVRVADDQKHQLASLPKRSVYLSDDEITGNLFNFTIAGFDTTASTMAYAIIALAIQPEWQDWIIEEIDRVSQNHPGRDYEASFPLLKRCLALMYETLRLYTPVLHITRCTTAPQTLPTFIPAGTTVFVAPACIHVSSALYSPDPLSFRPERWLSTSSNDQAHETLVDTPRGTFLPWSGGPRVCPGAKMAQVEFVGVMREIFASWKVEAVGRCGETEVMARERLKAVVKASQPKITLQVRRPSDVVLRWVKR